MGPDALVVALRAMGTAEDLLVQIQSSIKPPAPKVERYEQRLLQLRGLIDSTEAHSARLERSACHHLSRMELCLANRQRKEEELALLEEEYRIITDGKLSPNATPPAFVVCSSKPQQDMEEDLMEEETQPSMPPTEGGPVVHEVPAPPACDDVQDAKGQDAETVQPGSCRWWFERGHVRSALSP